MPRLQAPLWQLQALRRRERGPRRERPAETCWMDKWLVPLDFPQNGGENWDNYGELDNPSWTDSVEWGNQWFGVLQVCRIQLGEASISLSPWTLQIHIAIISKPSSHCVRHQLQKRAPLKHSLAAVLCESPGRSDAEASARPNQGHCKISNLLPSGYLT